MVAAMRKMLPWASILLYASYFIAGCGFLFARSPVLIGFLGEPLYYAWAGLLFVATTVLFMGMVAKKDFIEVCGTLPTAFAAAVYAYSAIANPPYGSIALGIAASGFLGAHVWWLVIRFLVIYPNLGSNDRRKTS